MDYLDVGGAVEFINVEVEATHCEHAAIPGDRVENISGTGACDAKHYVGGAGIDESGAIVLCYQSQ
jgi:hypothetical protein